jgi:hypothetical protein
MKVTWMQRFCLYEFLIFVIRKTTTTYTHNIKHIDVHKNGETKWVEKPFLQLLTLKLHA